MIRFNVNVKDSTKVTEMRNLFCEALVGTPAFKDSQIAVLDGNSNDEADFYLLVGNERDGHDIALTLTIGDENVSNVDIVEINLDCGGFIVPNPAVKIKGFLSDEKQESMINLCRLNGVKANGETIMLEMWMHGNGSENFQDHGVDVVTTDGKDFRLDPGEIPAFWPAEKFTNVKEGETVKLYNEFVIKAGTPGSLSNAKDTLVKVHLNMTTDQNKWRYKNYGPFENCYQLAIKAAR